MINYLISQLRSSKFSHPILVIESDDWGSERIPNNEVRKKLISFGFDMESNPHSKFDTLERLEDLEELLDLCDYFKNDYNKKIKITTNFITANPDFDKIRKDKFASYHYESFQNSYQKRDFDDSVFKKIKHLIDKGYLCPQFHGREHINVSFWMEELRNHNKYFTYAFEHNCYAIDVSTSRQSKNLLAALAYDNKNQFNIITQSLKEGHDIFKKAFGKSSLTFIAPRYYWNEELNPFFIKERFTHLQSSILQQFNEGDKIQSILRYTGQSNKNCNLKYMVRNVFFEPAYGNIDWVNTAFKKVEWAFRLRTPAIVSMHRVNFVGGLDSNQRDINLKQFKIFLEKIIQKYPNVEFLSSDELAKLI